MALLNIKKITRQEFINIVLCPAIFFIIALSIIGVGSHGPLLFRYDQELIANGEWWRMLSAHFTHSTWNHFFLNMLGLGILSILFSQVATWQRWLSLGFFSSLFCSLCFYFLADDDYIYVGMSDILHGVIIAYAFLDYRYFKFGNIILITGTIGKVLWEQSPWYIETSGDFIGGRVATESHFYGVISGLIIGCVFLYVRQRKEKQLTNTRSA